MRLQPNTLISPKHAQGTALRDLAQAPRMGSQQPSDRCSNNDGATSYMYKKIQFFVHIVKTCTTLLHVYFWGLQYFHKPRIDVKVFPTGLLNL